MSPAPSRPLRPASRPRPERSLSPMTHPRTNSSRPRRRLPAWIPAGLAGLAALALGACRKPAAATAAPAEVPVYVAPAEAKDVPQLVDAFGTIEAYRAVTLTPQVSGLLRAVDFNEGTMVKAGQPLYRIETDTYRQVLDKAGAALAVQRSALKPAEDRLRRSLELNQNKLLAPQDYESMEEDVAQAKANVAAAEAGVAQAELDLARTTITAPMDGVIGINPVHAGNLLTAQQTQLATVRQIEPIYVTFAVPGPDVPAILQGWRDGTLPVEVCRADDFKSAPVRQGDLAVIDNAIDTRTDTMTVKGRLANTDHLYWPGEFVRVRLVLAELRQATVIDYSAVAIGTEGPYVFVVTGGRSAELRQVVLGERQGTEVVVQSGVRPGEAVVVQGQLNLRNGAAVRVIPHEAHAAPETSAR